MGRTYGRTLYWCWKNKYLKRVTIMTGVIIENKVALCVFNLKENGKIYAIDPRGLAKTKKIALENQNSMEKYAIRNI